MTEQAYSVFFVEAIGCEIVHFLQFNRWGDLLTFFLLWVTWEHKYMAVLVKIYGHRTWGRFKRAGSM